MRRTLALGLLIAGLAGCGGSGSTGPSLDVTGTYRVNGVSERDGTRFTAVVNLQQDGSHVTGTYRQNNGLQYRIDASVSRTRVSGQMIGTNSAAVCDSVSAEFFPDGQTGQGRYSCRLGTATDFGSFTTVRT